MHLQHYDFAEGAWALHVYLLGAFALIRQDLYLPAFTALRSAIEHLAQDHLLFLGNRYRAILEGVSDEALNEWQRGMSQGQDECASVLQLRRVGRDRVEVIRSGPHYQGGDQGPDAPALSIYFSILEPLAKTY
jgi:hypothetical protein